MAEWLTAHECTHVAMEATGGYWKPVWLVLEAHFTLVFVPTSSTTNAYRRRNVAVTTTKKSLARTDRAWFRTKVLHACVPGFGRGGRDGM